VAEVMVRASEEVRRRLEPAVAVLRTDLAAGELHLVERGFPCPDRGLVVVFDREDLAGLEALLRPAGGARAGDPGEILPGRRGNAFRLLAVREIRCFRADGDLVTAELPTGGYEVEPRLYELEETFRSRGFVRIAKSLVVNVTWIAEIVPWLGGRLLLEMKDPGSRLEVARSYVAGFKRVLGMGGSR
jgi:DNA-binding LytR/AlgR family response regulator